MGMVGAIVAIVGGALAAASFIGGIQPKAKAMLDKFAPIQGWLGLVLLVWGVWGLIQFVLHLSMLSIMPVVWILFAASSAVVAIVGFLLGYELVVRFTLAGNPGGRARAKLARTALVRYQVPAGLAAACLGFLSLIAQLTI